MNFNFEYLKHGKALCGNVFRRFVETFNLHNDFIQNLCGDADLPKGGGHVNVDKTDVRHPVIRCNGCGGGGGGGGYVPLTPWKVFAVGKSEDVDHFFEIYIPNITVEQGGEVEIRFGSFTAKGVGFEEVEGTSRRFKVDAEDDMSMGTYFLYLYIYTVESETDDEEEDELVLKCTVSTEGETEFRNREDVLDIVFGTEIATVVIESNPGKPDVGKVTENPLNYHPSITLPLYT